MRNLYWVGYPVVRMVTKDGRPALFGLDTGAEGTYVTTSMLRKQPRTAVAMRRGSIGGLGSEEHRTEWVAREIALSDGDYAITLRNIPVAPERRWTFVNFDGVLGSDIALASRMHLDFVNGVFDVRKSANAGTGITVTVGIDETARCHPEGAIAASEWVESTGQRNTRKGGSEERPVRHGRSSCQGMSDAVGGHRTSDPAFVWR